MNKRIIMLFACMMVFHIVSAQVRDTLTNNSVIRMSRANLSDDMIIDMISESVVRFELSEEGMKSLKDENVSPRVIDAMKSAAGLQVKPIENAVPEVEKQDNAIMENQVNDTVSALRQVSYQAGTQDDQKAELQVSDLPGSQNVVQPDSQKVEESESITAIQPEQIPVPEAVVELQHQPQPQPQPVPESIPAPSSQPDSAPGLTVVAVNYVSPLIELVKFNDREYRIMEGAMADWEKQIKNSIAEINKINDKILQVETELLERKSADTKAFSPEIIALKKKLSLYRANYNVSRNSMVTQGDAIIKKFEDVSGDRIKAISKKYSEVSQLIGSAETDPGAGEVLVDFNYTRPIVSDTILKYIVPVSEMLTWYQNEIDEIKSLIDQWNPKARVIIQEDKGLKLQLEPILARQEELKSNSRENKEEIASLKKQSKALAKEREKLADRMEDDRKALASYLKKLSQQLQDSLKERIEDIGGNINYTYQERLGF